MRTNWRATRAYLQALGSAGGVWQADARMLPDDHSIDLRCPRPFVAIKRGRLLAEARALLTALRLPPSQLSILIVGDSAMQALNLAWRGIDRVTDVLSFPLDAPFAASHSSAAQRALGDVVLCAPQARRQASQHGHDPCLESTILLVHGVLHLLGYDHERGPAEAARMRRREAALLTAIAPLPARSLLARSVPRGSRG